MSGVASSMGRWDNAEVASCFSFFIVSLETREWLVMFEVEGSY